MKISSTCWQQTLIKFLLLILICVAAYVEGSCVGAGSEATHWVLEQKHNQTYEILHCFNASTLIVYEPAYQNPSSLSASFLLILITLSLLQNYLCVCLEGEMSVNTIFCSYTHTQKWSFRQTQCRITRSTGVQVVCLISGVWCERHDTAFGYWSHFNVQTLLFRGTDKIVL